MSAAAKTVIELFFSTDSKRRAFLGVKWTIGLEVLTGFLKRNVRFYKGYNIYSSQKVVYKMVRDSTSHFCLVGSGFLR